jgi:hypothetical protein
MSWLPHGRLPVIEIGTLLAPDAEGARQSPSLLGRQQKESRMRALCGSIIAAGALVGLGLATLGFGVRYQHTEMAAKPGAEFIWGGTPMTVSLWILIAGLLVGLAIAFVGLMFHHERRHRERLHHETLATGQRPL